MKVKTRPQYFSLTAQEYSLFGSGSVLLKFGNSPIHRKLAQYADFVFTSKICDCITYYFSAERFTWAKMFLESEKVYTEKKISIEEFRKVSRRESF